MPKEEFNPELAQQLAVANRILVAQSVLDTFGHVSVRDSLHKDRFLLARNMAPGAVRAEDIIAYDLDSKPIDAGGRSSYLERFIHGEIYRTHPEVNAVVHSHSASIIPFGTTDVPLKPIYHMASFLGAGAPIFEIREAGGDATDLLISNNALGKALAAKLGNAPVMLLRGHGDVAVGTSLRQAIFRAVFAEVNAKIAAQALLIGRGHANFLNEGESMAAAKTIDSQVARALELWESEALASMS
jgi:ribulose-5-phosphate 4-epimerase/fuculose-1-phosphate aldolase